jgi:tetratricopeptide (TPR) repeat protein
LQDFTWALDRQNDPDHALVFIEQSFTDFQKLNDLYWAMKAYKSLGDLLVLQGKLTKKERVERGFELARAAGERVELAEAYHSLGYYHYMINQLDEARKYAAEASELLQQIGSNLHDPRLLLAELAWLTGDYKEAKALYKEIQVRLGLLGEKNISSSTIGILGTLALEEGDFGLARVLLEDSLATAREVQNNFDMLIRLIEIGNLFYLEGKPDEFKRKYQESVPLVKKLPLLGKSHCLCLTLRLFDRRMGLYIVSILGALYHVQRETEILFDPIFKRFYDRAETHARKVLSNEEFEMAFAEGQKLSLDEAIDLVLKTVEEI